MTLDELTRRAEALGVATSFPDARQATAPPGGRPPVVVLRRGLPAVDAGTVLGGDEPLRLVLESGEERPLPAALPGGLPLGYHRVLGPSGDTLLAVAPARCARGRAGASATSATWPGSPTRQAPARSGPASRCSTRCTPPRRRNRAPTTPPAGSSATRSTCGS